MGGAVLCTKRSDESWDGLAWATPTAILFDSEVEGPEATAETATESPEDGGAEIEGAVNKSTDRYLGRFQRGTRSGYTEKLEKPRTKRPTHSNWATTLDDSKTPPIIPRKKKH